MRRFAFGLGLVLISLFSAIPARAEGTTGTPVATGTLAGQFLTRNWSSSEWVHVCGYYNCGDGGEDLLHKNTSGRMADGVLCFNDTASNVFCRPTHETLNARMGGVYGDFVHDDTTALNATLAVAAVHDITTVKACGLTKALTADIAVPAGVTLNLCAKTPSARATLDYTPSAFGAGVLVISSSHTITFGTGDASGLANGVIERGDGSYPPATFVPATLRDKLNIAGAFAGTAITLPGDTKAVHLHDLMCLGFTTCVASNSKGLRWDHIYTDATNCYDVNNSADVAHLEDIVCIPYLTKAGALTWEIDNILADGAGHYKLVAEAPTTDIRWHDGDEVYVSTTVGGGTQSANGLHTFSCGGTDCTLVPNGTDGCVASAGCQEAVMSDTQSAASTFTASWIAGLRSDGTSQPLITSSDLTYVAVGQTLTGKCDGGSTDAFPANTTVLDKLPDLGWVIPSAAPLCAGTARTLTATDDAFVKTKRGAEMSPSQRHGTGFYVRNSGGVTVWNLHSYTHDIELHLGKGAHQFRGTAPSFGENDPLAADDLTTVLIDGDHDGDDADNVWLENCTLGQHATISLSVNTDGKANNNFVNCGVGPAAGHKNGTLLKLLAGHVLFSNGGGAVPGNIIVADGQTFHTVQIDGRNDGTGYTVGDVLTGTVTCTGNTPQYTVTKVDPSDLSVTDGTQTRAGVGCSWPVNADGTGASFNTTGGTGTSAKLTTDGFKPATLQMSNLNAPQADVYIQTPGGPSFLGSETNVCALLTTCRSNSGTVKQHFSISDYGCVAATADCLAAWNAMVSAAKSAGSLDLYTDGTPIHVTSGSLEIPAGMTLHCGGTGAPYNNGTAWASLPATIFIQFGTVGSPTGYSVLGDAQSRLDGCNILPINSTITGVTNTTRSIAAARDAFVGTGYVWNGRGAAITNSNIYGVGTCATGSSVAGIIAHDVNCHGTNGLSLDQVHSGANMSGWRNANFMFLNFSNNEESRVISAVANDGTGLCEYTLTVASVIAENDWINPVNTSSNCSNNGPVQAHVIDSTHIVGKATHFTSVSTTATQAVIGSTVITLASTTNVAPGMTISGTGVTGTILAISNLSYGGGGMVYLDTPTTGVLAATAVTLANPAYVSGGTMYFNAAVQRSGYGFQITNTQGGECDYCNDFGHETGFHFGSGASNFRFIGASHDGYKELNDPNVVGMAFTDDSKNNGCVACTMSSIGTGYLQTSSASVPNYVVGGQSGIQEDTGVTGAFDIENGQLMLTGLRGVVQGTSWIGDSTLGLWLTGSSYSGQTVLLQNAGDQLAFHCTSSPMHSGSTAVCDDITGATIGGSGSTPALTIKGSNSANKLAFSNTNTPTGQVKIGAAASGAYTIASNGTGTPTWTFNLAGVASFSGVAPTSITSNSVAGTLATGSGLYAGAVTLGATPSTDLVITFPTAAPNGWVCRANDETHPLLNVRQTAGTTTTCTLAASAGMTAADVVDYTAVAY